MLTIEQIKCFLSHLREPCRTAVFVDASSGLRVGELLGLKWEDVNFAELEVNVTRSMVKQKITRCKTEASRKPIPLDPELSSRGAPELETAIAVPASQRLGLCQSPQKRQTALLARFSFPSAFTTCADCGEDSGHCGLAHLAVIRSAP